MHEFVLSKVPLPLSYICYPPPKDPSDIRVGFFHLLFTFSALIINPLESCCLAPGLCAAMKTDKQAFCFYDNGPGSAWSP